MGNGSRRLLVAGALVLIAAVPGGARGAVPSGPTPCVWARYQGPLLGHASPSVCAPVHAPPGRGPGRVTVSHERGVGSVRVGVGANVPIPGV